MIELAVGTRFYYNGRPYKVVEIEDEYFKCSECNIFHHECNMFNCASASRQDGKNVCFQMG